MNATIASPMRRTILPADINKLRPSEGLPQSDEKLRRPEARDRVQQMAHVEANRSDRCRISHSKAHGVAVTIHKTIEAKMVVDVAAVVKHRAAQVLHDGQGEAQLCVEDKDAVPADRH